MLLCPEMLFLRRCAAISIYARPFAFAAAAAENSKAILMDAAVEMASKVAELDQVTLDSHDTLQAVSLSLSALGVLVCVRGSRTSKLALQRRSEVAPMPLHDQFCLPRLTSLQMTKSKHRGPKAQNLEKLLTTSRGGGHGGGAR